METNQIKFSLAHPKYCQKSFLGRYKHFFEATNPFLLASNAEEAKQLIESYKDGTVSKDVTDDELWRAKYITHSAFSRDGTKIPWPFRITGYVIGNIPITVGLMWPGMGTAGAIFFQWANQTQNAFLNHYNRSSIHSVPWQETAKCYAGAVSVAVAVHVSSNALITKTNIFSGALKLVLGRLVPFASVASANALNTWLMRQGEMEEGIQVKDAETQEIVGTSKLAAKKAVIDTCLSRVVLSIFAVGVPPFILPLLEKLPPFSSSPKLKLPLHISFVSAMLFLVVPMAIAVFEENIHLPASKLEPEFVERFGPDKILQFNKGL